jgi:hypothetical protein
LPARIGQGEPALCRSERDVAVGQDDAVFVVVFEKFFEVGIDKICPVLALYDTVQSFVKSEWSVGIVFVSVGTVNRNPAFQFFITQVFAALPAAFSVFDQQKLLLIRTADAPEIR